MTKKHILIVEDEPCIAGFYEEFLGETYQTTVCGNGVAEGVGRSPCLLSKIMPFPTPPQKSSPPVISDSALVDRPCLLYPSHPFSIFLYGGVGNGNIFLCWC